MFFYFHFNGYFISCYDIIFFFQYSFLSIFHLLKASFSLNVIIVGPCRLIGDLICVQAYARPSVSVLVGPCRAQCVGRLLLGLVCEQAHARPSVCIGPCQANFESRPIPGLVFQQAHAGPSIQVGPCQALCDKQAHARPSQGRCSPQTLARQNAFLNC